MMTAENDSNTDWRERAAELAAHGVPERRAEVVALIEIGHTHSEVADILDLDTRSNVGTHVQRYRENQANAEWRAEHAPNI